MEALVKPQIAILGMASLADLNKCDEERRRGISFVNAVTQSVLF